MKRTGIREIARHTRGVINEQRVEQQRPLGSRRKQRLDPAAIQAGARHSSVGIYVGIEHGPAADVGKPARDRNLIVDRRIAL
jgi:hypothetical protein